MEFSQLCALRLFHARTHTHVHTEHVLIDELEEGGEKGNGEIQTNKGGNVHVFSCGNI